jgi:hypothetical protein
VTSKAQAWWKGILRGRQAKEKEQEQGEKETQSKKKNEIKVHNQATSRRMEMTMMSTMLKCYQREHSSPTPRDHIRVYPLIMIP